MLTILKDDRKFVLRISYFEERILVFTTFKSLKKPKILKITCR